MFPIIFAALLISDVSAFIHPGALHTSGDFERINTHVVNGDEPWNTTWGLLTTSPYAQSSYQPKPQATVYRGYNGVDAENYQYLYKDAAAAYQLAVRWKISNDSAYADAAINILGSWAATLTAINGTSDKFLASGLYGYQMANAAELMRDYSGWDSSNKTATGRMLTSIFASMNTLFLENHNGQNDYHYYANWDQCNLASLIAIGIFTDNQTMYDDAVQYMLTGPSNGALPVFDIANYTEDGSGKVLIQGQEAGRDQGHATLDIVLLGVIARQSYNQGDDLFAAYNNEILNAAEYVSKYNIGYDVPYTPYDSYQGNQSVISNNSRGDIRPGFELLSAHYGQLKGLNSSWTDAYRDFINANSTDGVEGGGGNYGSTSGGFDGLGFGTLLYRIS
ncbi:chondroitin AC/alginate lyase [Talaromyces proteolyticus]|uniref:Chondroitin AC/alginate lyase n=1 Tax=Talaromyces proteolyticus TaxID=1131652 RepID=A0AAD4L5Z5_9EURO|nr:chondroitin AC/alginate lyase [Talaromyces proteolyticus]KAH8705736.1 chondroitin AC/alginate lyase [Talaromyces proteolyticus]